MAFLIGINLLPEVNNLSDAPMVIHGLLAASAQVQFRLDGMRFACPPFVAVDK
ncbi:MAG: hypothetical protein N838_24330 [Thiohalocapsa sp. PB-PSB1]|jgi:hypothetical protein|nr:MAG: hypothetical protein N838_20405 [Thiohalocapsa sp. PB-PSB1]QQO56008.1 MAG: hypothetical protein N838_24330 [Thiohalocapsa sp. PB-PSB1]